MKRVLMIAYHYPPLRGSSGIQRTLKFSQYLPEHGWQPSVLTAHPRAYGNTGDDQLRDIPPDMEVRRAFALDVSRHLAIKGRYPGLLALPDRWASWWLGAVPAGLQLIRRHRPDVIWSTYPISTAHLIGLSLHRLTGIPWVADFRDPMTDIDYPPDPTTRRLYQWIEQKTVRHCHAAVCTSPGAIGMYTSRFPEIPASRFRLLENGYDEETFADAKAATGPASNATSNETSGIMAANGALPRQPIVLVHSGIVYPSERDPRPLFEAVAALLAQQRISPDRVRIVLRATAHDAYLSGLIAQYGIGAIVSLAPHVSYREALAEMMGAGGLLVLQASNCNHQIPAKLYEYLRARRPILALTDPVGDTATTLRNAGIDTIAPLDSKEAIMEALLRFLSLVEQNHAPLASDRQIEAHSRRSRTGELARLLDEAAAAGRGRK